MIFLVHRPLSGDVVGMTAQELNEYLAIPDHKGLDFKVEPAFELETHECAPAEVTTEADVPRD